MNIRIRLDPFQEKGGRWVCGWGYEVGPCRGGPTGITRSHKTELGATQDAMRTLGRVFGLKAKEWQI